MQDFPIPVVGFVARHSNSGKTTLIEKLIPLLVKQGIRVAIVKHVHHGFDMDRDGKDSQRFRQAGSRQVMVASDQRWALLTELDDPPDYPDLAQLVAQLDIAETDLVIAEGFKDYAYTKIEVSLDDDVDGFLCHGDDNIVAVVSRRTDLNLALPSFSIDSPDEIALFIASTYIR